MRLTHVLRGEGLSTGTPVLLAWAFAVMAAFLVLGVAAGVVWIRTEGLKTELQRRAERDARISTDTVKHLVGEVLGRGPLGRLETSGRWHEDHTISEAERARLDAMVGTIGGSTPLSKVKLFNRSGTVIYSSVPSEVGTPVLRRWAYRAAIEGRPASVMSRMALFSAHDGERRDVHIVETYAAFSLSGQGIPDGVIKIYTDITADAAEHARVIEREAHLVAIAMLVLYGLLLVLIALGTRILTRTIGLAERQAAKLVEADVAFRDGIDSMADGMVVFDAQDRLVVWNDAYARMVPELIVHYKPGMAMRDLFVLAADVLYGHKGHEAETWADRRLTMTATPTHPLEFQFADGRSVRIVTRPTSAGGTVSTYRDVTLEREAQRALAESEQRFRDFADSTADWFWELDGDLRFSYLSTSSELVNGAPAETIYGKRPVDFRPAGVSDVDWEEHLATLHAHQPYKDFRFETAPQAGRSRTVSVSGKPIFAADGRFLGYRGIGADITPMIETLQALESTKALAESSARLLHDGIESMLDGYLMFDAEQRVVLWNTRYAETFPHLRGTLRIGLSLRQLIAAHAESDAYGIAPSARTAWIENTLTQMLRDKVAFRRELADGRVMQVQVSRTSGGAAIHVIRNVTSDLRAEIAVARSEAMFRDGIESMVDGFVMFDAEDRVVHWNSRYLAIYPYLVDRMSAGMEARALMRMHAESDSYCIAPADREAWIASTLGHRPGNDQNFTRELADGRVLRVRGTHTAAGGSIYVVTDVTDETSAKRALERALDELHASQDAVRRLAMVAQHTDNSVIITDAKGCIEWINPGFTRITGYALEDVVGRVPGSFLQGPDTDPATIAQMGAAVRAGESFQVEVLNYDRAGKPYWLAIDCSPVRNAAGEIERFVAIESDVTERKLQERRLAEALDREREAASQQKRFVSIAAHEFRTPLTIIDGSAQRLARYADRITPADLRERVQKIRSAVARMAQMVDLTLNSARLDEGRLDVSLGALELPALIAGICRRIEGISPGFAFNVLCVGEAMPLVADARLLDQIFTNLISNAVKYSGASRRVDVTLRYAGEQVQVSVRDFGIGIPPDEQAQLFTRFFRASNARNLPGTGIGLSLVSDLVKLHGGEVSVASDGHSGTIFTVTLPINADRNRVASLAPAA